MWRNYWTVAVRALAKSKTYSIINIAGLAIGMAACILILLYVRYENSYDKWLPDAENTYELQAWYPNPKSGIPLFSQMSAYVTKDRIKKDFPQVERVGYLLSGTPVILKDGQSSFGEDYGTTDDDFLKVVKLPMLSGTTLTAAGTAVLSQTEAVRRFGTDQVLGRTLSTFAKGAARGRALFPGTGRAGARRWLRGSRARAGAGSCRPLPSSAQRWCRRDAG